MNGVNILLAFNTNSTGLKRSELNDIDSTSDSLDKTGLGRNGLHIKTDEELVQIVPYDEFATTTLITRYVKLIWVKANIMANSLADAEDLAQEGFLGLLNAISKFDHSKKVKFSTFAEVCINNKIKTAFVKNNKIDLPIGNITTAEDSFIDDNPESILLQKERLEEIYNSIISLLSKQEWEILKLYLNDSSYLEIAQQFAISQKSVDNAMQRVRRKLKRMWRADHFKNY